MTTRLCILYANFGPYHVSRLRALSNHLDCFTAVEISARQEQYPWPTCSSDMRFERRTLRRTIRKRSERPTKKRLCRGCLISCNPRKFLQRDIMMLECARPRCRAKRHSVPCIMTTDSTFRDKPGLWPKEFLKGVWCRRYYSALFLSALAAHPITLTWVLLKTKSGWERTWSTMLSTNGNRNW